MRSRINRSYSKMWTKIEKELTQFSKEKHYDDYKGINLFVAIIIKAAEDHDRKYFESNDYLDHCKLLRLNSKFVYTIVSRGWAVEKSGKMYEPPKSWCL